MPSVRHPLPAPRRAWTVISHQSRYLQARLSNSQDIGIIVDTPVILPVDEERGLVIPQGVEQVVVVLERSVVKGDGQLVWGVAVADDAYVSFGQGIGRGRGC